MKLVNWPNQQGEPPVNGNSVVWTIVGVLAIIALLFYVIPRIH